MFDIPHDTTCALPLQQHPFFAMALSACGRPPLMLDEAPARLVMRRRFKGGLTLSMLSRVQVPTGPDDLEQLRIALGRGPVILSPDAPCPELAGYGLVPLMTPATLGELDLTGPEQTRRARLHPKWRNRLRQAEQSPLRVTRCAFPADPGHWLLRADTLQQRRRGYRTWPEALTLAYAAQAPEQAQLFTAQVGNRIVAAMLFLRHGAIATYHIGHTNTEGRALSAHTLLLWTAACWLAEQGHLRLDLGLIDTQRAPGLARFKLGAGATPRRLGGTWGWWPPLGRALAPLARLDRARMEPPPGWTGPDRPCI